MIQALPVDTQEIVVIASRAPQEEERTAASVTIVDAQRIERLAQPLVPALLRYVPSVAVSTSGPAGSLTDVRIRGAEANHTLLFVDGIRVNDPAAGNIPRFELLNSDLFSRIEVVRGPQSALWGSEAIGGVVSVGAAPNDEQNFTALGELGFFGFRRAAVQGSAGSGDLNLSGALGWQKARGVDSFDGQGDRDGYRNLSGRLRAVWAVSDIVELGASGFALSGRNQFDGYDATFVRADTPDSSSNWLRAGRLWARIGGGNGPWVAHLSASRLGSSNRNLFAGEEINQSWGKRRTFSAQVEHRLATGRIDHVLIAAADVEKEEFRSRDVIYGGFSNQDRSRSHHAVTGEWRASSGSVQAGLAVRHDSFSRFKDATTVRANLLGEIGGGFALTGSYAEGIAQPTFFDLYGFFPGSFVGNPNLKPESSRGFEAGLRYRKSGLRAALNLYRQLLKDEIVDTPDFTSTVNAGGTSRRAGVEAELGWEVASWLRLSSHYAWLNARQDDDLHEARRPKHSGSLIADGRQRRFTYGAAIAYTGEQIDRRDVFPYDRVRLSAYWRADARLGYAIGNGLELFGRLANAFDARQQDVFGYRTEGRSAYAGIRLAPRR